MKEVSTSIEYEGKKYDLYYNLNVMMEIQGEYKTLAKWGELTDGKSNDGEPDIRALCFGVTAMINEGIDINNEKNGTKEPHITLKEAGRLLTDIGLSEMTKTVNDVVIESAGESKENLKNE